MHSLTHQHDPSFSFLHFASIYIYIYIYSTHIDIYISIYMNSAFFVPPPLWANKLRQTHAPNQMRANALTTGPERPLCKLVNPNHHATLEAPRDELQKHDMIGIFGHSDRRLLSGSSGPRIGDGLSLISNLRIFRPVLLKRAGHPYANHNVITQVQTQLPKVNVSMLSSF